MSLYCEALAGCIELCKPACFVVRIRRPAPTVQVMTNIGRSEVALRASTGLFVVMVGCGAALGGVEQSAPTPGTSATSAMPSETPAPPPAPGGPTGGGGALPVLPATACIIGLNCGCVRGLTCPGAYPHHHGATTNGQPNYAPAAPRPGPSGGG
jgi:hypothetical protein